MTSAVDPCRVMEIPDSAASAAQALTDLAPICSNPGDAVPSRPKRKRAGWVENHHFFKMFGAAGWS